jgi:flavin reductase (DIM6/NTAB) family NADH-FMN oxidoreductase RutF
MVAGFEKTRRAARLSDVRGDDAGRRCSAGCLVGFTSQVSIHPRRFLVGPSKRNHTYRVAQHAEQLAVNVVPRSHCDLARLFGSETGDETDKFARCSWRPSPAGLPILQDAAGWFVGDVLSRFDLSDHGGLLLEPVAGSAPDSFEQLVTFSDVRDLDPGHEAVSRGGHAAPTSSSKTLHLSLGDEST